VSCAVANVSDLASREKLGRIADEMVAAIRMTTETSNNPGAAWKARLSCDVMYHSLDLAGRVRIESWRQRKWLLLKRN
jgi:hypothetical protein